MKKLTEWLVKDLIEEDIEIPVNVGDTILTGRFKNKKTIVKSIGKDEHGMPTINGKQATTFRLNKKDDTKIINARRKKQENISEGVNDPGIFKAVFLAGGPGSGKTYVTKQLFGIPDRLNISMTGLKMVNSDKELKFLLNKFGFGTDLDKMPDDLFNQLTNPKDKDYSGLRDYSKELTKQRMKQYQDGKLGMIIDGTGHDYNKLAKMKKELEQDGYDTYMVFVITDLETAQKRNQQRDRILPPDLVKKSWTDVMSNGRAFKALFKGNISYVDNSKTLNYMQAMRKFDTLMKKEISKFIKKPIKNKIAKQWIKKQQILKRKGLSEAPRVPRKKGQHRGSKSHSDLYTDENPKGTIKGLKFATVKDAQASVSKIKNSGRSHAHKIQAAVAMEQRAREMGKTSQAAVYRRYINQMKKKTKKKNEQGLGSGKKVVGTNTYTFGPDWIPTSLGQRKKMKRLHQKLSRSIREDMNYQIEEFDCGCTHLYELENIDEKWTKKYKRSIDCNNPKGFSQRAHCQGRKKRKSESLVAADGTIASPSRKMVKKMKKRGNTSVPYGSGYKKVNEDRTKIKKVVGIYGGRFQPFGPHHKKTYDWLKSRVDDAYITTSDIKQPPRHPMNFNEKVRHMVKMGIPKNRIVKEKSPYVATNVLKKYDEKTTAVIYIFGAKDAGRLKGGKYFKDYDKNLGNILGYKEHGYILTAPHVSVKVGGKEVSGTVMRQLLGSPDYEKDRKKLFKQAFGYFNQGIFNMMTNKFKKLFESFDKFLSKNNIQDIIKESSLTVGSPVDDGPPIFYKGFNDYEVESKKWIDSMYRDTGWEIVDYILSPNAMSPSYDYTLKYSIVPAVSFSDNSKYEQHINNVVLRNVGYEVVKWMGLDDKGVHTEAPPLPGADGETENTDLKESQVFSVDWWTQKLWLEESEGMTLEEGVRFDNFLKQVSKAANKPLDIIRKTMMNKNTFAIAKLNDFSLEKVTENAKKGFQAYQRIINYVPDRIAQQLAKTKFGQKKEKALKKLDNFLQNHPKLKRVMGLGAAAGVTYAWTKMTFIGDPEYDLDLSAAATAAATGDVSFSDLFAGEMGTKFLVLTAVGTATGLTAPYVKLLGKAGTMAAGLTFGAVRAYKKRKKEKIDKQKKTKGPDVVKNPNPRGRKKMISKQSAVRWVSKNKGEKAAKKYVKSLSEIINLDNEVSLIIEGGAYGHMDHPFDDKNLTFSDLKQIIINGLGGNLNREDNVTEKLDGQNLMVSWVNGKLVTARNKGQLKNFGATAMDTAGVASKFAGRGDIKNAFVFAMKDLSKSVGRLSDAQKEKVFGNGKRWMNLEVIYPKSANVIDYDKSEIIFHGTLEYDESGKAIGQPADSGRMLAGMIKQVNQNVQKTYNIGKPQFLTVPKVQNFGKKKRGYLNRLNKLQKQFNLKDNDTLAKYHQSFWEEFIFNASKQFKYKIPNRVLVNLTKRWAFFDKSYKIPTMKKDIKNKKFLDWALSFDKNDHQKWVKDNMKPFEVLFFDVGAEILKNIGGFLSVSPDKAVQRIRKDVINAISVVKKSKDVKKIETLKNQVDKLNKIGGLSSIVPSEGIVFKYKGKTYKFTGAFAPINQILGLLNF